MGSFFIKLVDEAVSERQLSVELNKIKPVKIEGESAERIVKNLETLLEGKDSLRITAGVNIFSNRLVLMEEVFDIFEEQSINDSAYYYKIFQNSGENNGFQIYCRRGDSIEIKRIRSN